MEKGNNNIQEKRDVKDLMVCLYDGNTVGLFNTLSYKFNELAAIYDSGTIYLGLDSEEIGLKVIHQGLLLLDNYVGRNHTVILEGTEYNVNCKIDAEIGFEGIRKVLHEAGEIGEYVVGKATDEEILKVLKFAMKRYKAKTATYNGEKINDVSNLLVCSYDENSVGLFEPETIYLGESHAAPAVGCLYTEINSQKSGMKSIRPGSKRHETYFYFIEAGSIVEVNDKEYRVDLQINNEMRFDDVRLQMYNEGLIKSYVPGLASNKEIDEVLKYASNHFETEKPMQKRK